MIFYHSYPLAVGDEWWVYYVGFNEGARGALVLRRGDAAAVSCRRESRAAPLPGNWLAKCGARGSSRAMRALTAAR